MKYLKLEDYDKMVPNDDDLFDWYELDEGCNKLLSTLDYKELPKQSQYDYMYDWKEHERKQCFTYELAIRDLIYKKNIQEALAYYKSNKEAIDFIIETMKKVNHGVKKIYQRESLHYDESIHINKDYFDKYEKLKLMLSDIEILTFNSGHLSNSSRKSHQGNPSRIEYINRRNFGQEIYELIYKIIRCETKYEQNREILNTDFIHILIKKVKMIDIKVNGKKSYSKKEIKTDLINLKQMVEFPSFIGNKKRYVRLSDAIDSLLAQVGNITNLMKNKKSSVSNIVLALKDILEYLKCNFMDYPDIKRCFLKDDLEKINLLFNSKIDELNQNILSKEIDEIISIADIIKGTSKNHF
jgi:hypothetical protein